MKAQVRSRYHYLTLFILMCLSLGFLSSANAHYKKHHFKNIPVAYCTTSGTGIPLIPFVCCKVGDDDDNGNGWHHMWVRGGCGHIDDARYSRKCSVVSPVLGTNAPIVGDCQFSHSTREG